MPSRTLHPGAPRQRFLHGVLGECAFAGHPRPAGASVPDAETSGLADRTPWRVLPLPLLMFEATGAYREWHVRIVRRLRPAEAGEARRAGDALMRLAIAW
jgi:hypothetical protein